MLKLLVAVYVVSLVVANLLVAKLGPAITPVLAFFLIGLDLSLRDWLHVRLRPWQMGTLIAGTGLLTYILNPAAQFIAIASAVSFAAASLADWLVFVRMPGTFTRKSNTSNVAGALVDSVLFPTLAFGMLMPQIVLAQFAAKVIGGAVWTWLLSMRRAQP